jgi:hypothetical protein
MRDYAAGVDEAARGQRLSAVELWLYARRTMADQDREAAQREAALARHAKQDGPRLPPPGGWVGGGG